MKTFLLLLLAGSAFAIPSVVFDCTRIPETCKNMCFAINCKHEPSQLTFDNPSATVKKGRRNAAGCTTNNRCKGRTDKKTTCDEYPFASTAQGGASAVTRCVSIDECRSQGGSLSSFYRNLKANDKFTVTFKSFNSIAFCVAPFGQCKNDGEEFQHGAPATRRDLPSNGTEPPGQVYRTKRGLELYAPSGDVQVGDRVFVPDPELIERALDDDCSNGVDETRKRDIDEAEMEELGDWDEVESVVPN
ncbi:hypothetical protein GLOTRDRAFT_110324 [Gloeophyllum trabeum ATCC 11539]|uniref:Deoxyribonuclease NucA/NucB domain-containing protein n=1 Tax=Gloeophyllum trabeum (strain ATCC 11539 / FP-39264 / Madison 617) TaxID=670483 RepID=S7QBX0_GLOTA|nr:uncharacterized protein GLOTRDRAFT_110324 [Gloeophyllum trabeum ATCC 11539]EPQ56853.1 hypothetical protein GLOTRDRAFT_110324 [Gloeophyllum trabeum ATCC 11539]